MNHKQFMVMLALKPVTLDGQPVGESHYSTVAILACSVGIVQFHKQVMR